jgi:RNA polymerase sigma-70 factor (ECF subfamily)
MHQTYAAAPAREKETVDDAALVKAARRDRSAFAALYRRYVGRIYRYVYSRVGRKADAEDLTARIFTEALEGLGGYQDLGTFSAWLFTIAHRRVVDHYRRKRPTQPLDEAINIESDDPNPLAQVAHNEQLEHLAQLVAGLDEDKQDLLQLRFAGELSYREVGKIVGRNEGAVKMAVHRLLRRLEEAWGGDDE